MASGYLPTANKPNSEKLAKDIYLELFNHECQNLLQGKFLGATLFPEVAVAGIGLATSQMASAVILATPNDYQQHLRFRLEVFGWSVLIGATAALITYAFFRRK